MRDARLHDLDAGRLEPVLDGGLQVLAHFGGVRGQGFLARGVRVVRELRGRGAERRLGLHGEVLLVVLHLEQRLGGLDDLPDDHRADLDGVGVVVVHLELRRLEVAHAQRQPALDEERVGKEETVGFHRADVLAEEHKHLGIVGIHDEEPAQEKEREGEDEDAQDDEAGPSLRCGLRDDRHREAGDDEQPEQGDETVGRRILFFAIHGGITQVGDGNMISFRNHKVNFSCK